MEDYQERVLTEKLELDQKIRKLSDFVCSDKAEVVSNKEHGRMVTQLDAMFEYSRLLRLRISAFKKDATNGE